jgi:hypothetical protein
MWDLLRTKWYRDRFFSEFFGFPLSISFHRGSPYSCIIWGMNKRPVDDRSSDTVSPHGHENKTQQIRRPNECQKVRIVGSPT